MSEDQNLYVDGIAQDFQCNSIDELAQKLGYTNSQEMATTNNFENIYDLFTSPGYAGRYLTIESQLGF